MARKWTPAQKMAMSTLGRTLLISAAAGSGKTATLTERIIRRLTDPENPAELSRLLIVTFTRAAAAELRERISGALSEAISRDPGNRHLQRQLIGLGSAHISTIDAFCREPVKAHFAELGLPATTRIADEAELNPLCERVMGELMDEYYLKYRVDTAEGHAFSLLDGNPFADLCDSLTPSKNDRELIPTLLGLYNRLLNFPAELERLKTESESLLSAKDADFFTTEHGAILKEWVGEFSLSATAALSDALVDIRADEKAYKAYGPAFESDLAFVTGLSAMNTYAEMQGAMSGYANLRLGALRNAPEHIAARKDTRTELVKDIKSLRDKYFSDSPARVADQMARTGKLCAVLYDFLTEYDTRIREEKRERGICDFTDNRRYLLELLRRGDGSFAAEMAAQYDEVYIDEYQDVDEMQDTIFRLVGGDHRFMVGDIKQSIYGFRGADPSVFARYRKALTNLIPTDGEPVGLDPKGNSIFMSENFRCDESVIRVTNAVCGHIFTACPQSVGYTPADDLGFSKLKPHGDYLPPRAEITVLLKSPAEEGEEAREEAEGGELSGVYAEATYVANRIAELLRNRTPLANGEPVKPSDIVILMRSRTALSAYMEALTALGIPTGSEELDAMEAGKDVLRGGDMSYLHNLLRVLDNPDDDIPLSEVLRAPFPGLDLEELLTVRGVGDREAESHSLYMGLEEYLEKPDAEPALREKVSAFITWVEGYRRLTATQPADGILRLLRRDPNCACRQSRAFLYLYESARTCRSSTFVSLYAFLQYFENKLATTRNVATATRETDGGHVSIMTIHHSKGLEFPVCFVVRCGQYFSNASMNRDLIFEKGAGVSMKLYSRLDADGNRHPHKEDTLLRAVSALATRTAEREEEMRVLYVAMTRARERLFLVGRGNDRPASFSAGDRYATLSCNNYLRWVLAGLEAHPEVGDFFTLRYVYEGDVTPGEKLPPRAQLVDLAEDGVRSRYRQIYRNRPLPTAMERLVRQVPTKVPASRMREDMLDSCVFFHTDVESEEVREGKLPAVADGDVYCDAQSISAIRESLRLMSTGGADEFEILLGENRRPTAAEKGTATHLFLQYCSYDRVRRQGVEEEIARLAERGFLNERTANILDRRMLDAFFGSAFFAHIREAESVLREFRFNRFVPLASLTRNPAFAEALGDRTLYVQGSVDVLALFPDGHLELCDYKTDRISPEERANPSLLAARMTERHGAQLAQYALAVEEIFGVRPSKVYVFSLPLGEALEIGI